MISWRCQQFILVNEFNEATIVNIIDEIVKDDDCNYTSNVVVVIDSARSDDSMTKPRPHQQHVEATCRTLLRHVECCRSTCRRFWQHVERFFHPFDMSKEIEHVQFLSTNVECYKLPVASTCCLLPFDMLLRHVAGVDGAWVVVVFVFRAYCVWEVKHFLYRWGGSAQLYATCGSRRHLRSARSLSVPEMWRGSKNSKIRSPGFFRPYLT